MGKAAGSAGELGWGISVFGITAWKCWPGVFLEPKVLGSRCFGVSWKCLVALCVLLCVCRVVLCVMWVLLVPCGCLWLAAGGILVLVWWLPVWFCVCGCLCCDILCGSVFSCVPALCSCAALLWALVLLAVGSCAAVL